MDGIEKIICCDRGGNDNALAAAIMSNRRGDDGNMWAMNSWMNNPFAYALMMRMFGNGWENGNNPAIEAMRTQLQENQNSTLLMDAIGNGFNRNDFAISQLSQNLNCDFNSLQSAVCDVQGLIREVGGQVGFSAERVINAANLGDLNIIQALKDCYCTTQKEILKLGADLALQNCKDTGELRNGQRDLGQAITQGFAATSYETKSQTCEIINNQNKNAQELKDLLNQHWRDEQAREIQDLKVELSQYKQTEAILARLKGNGCGCNNGCSFSNQF